MEVLERACRARGTRPAADPVLFVGGLGRSGSTVLDMLLAQEPGMVPVGEVRHLWERGLRDNDLCGCGAPFHDCPFWRAVGERAFGGWHRLDPDYALATARSCGSPPPALTDRLAARPAECGPHQDARASCTALAGV